MGEQLLTADGAPVEVDQTEAAFAAAMAAPPADKPGMAAPPRRPPEPPADAQAAPHGWTYAEGEWRPKRAPGRPRATAADKPRVTEAPPTPPAAGPAGAASKPDYSPACRITAESLWLVMAVAPVPDAAFGFKLGSLRRSLRAQAALIEMNVDGLAGGLNLIGQNNRFVGRMLSRGAAGEGGLWVLPAVMMLAPFAAQSAQLWAGKVDDATIDALAARTETGAANYLAQLAGQAAQDATAAADAPV